LLLEFQSRHDLLVMLDRSIALPPTFSNSRIRDVQLKLYESGATYELNKRPFIRLICDHFVRVLHPIGTARLHGNIAMCQLHSDTRTGSCPFMFVNTVCCH
jgi:hypothetical protein